MLQRWRAGWLVLFVLLLLIFRNIIRLKVKISRNFEESEFNVDKSTPEYIRANVRSLVEGLLQPLRNFIGKPVIIGAGYRNAIQNKAAGGVTDSQHLTGQAADIKVRGLNPLKLAEIIKDNFGFDVLIYYSPGSHKGYPNGGVHVSWVRGANRKIFKMK